MTFENSFRKIMIERSTEDRPANTSEIPVHVARVEVEPSENTGIIMR